MTTQAQYAILDRLLAYQAAGTTVDAGRVAQRPARDYIDPARHEADLAIFRTTPIVVGLSRDIEAAGAFKTIEIGGVALLIVRGRDGVARAFRNMCRHRGVRLTGEACGQQQRFSCPFHAWTYDDQGRLIGVPQAPSFGERPDETTHLIEYKLAERHGILWVKLSGDMPDMDAWLGEIGPELAALDLGARERMATRDLDAAINWKLANDTYGETYHFDMLHKETIRHYFQSNIHDYQTFGRHHRMVFAGNNLGELTGQARETWNYGHVTLTAYFIFPNTQLISIPGHVDLFQILPDARDPRKSKTIYSYYPTPGFVIPDGAIGHDVAFELTAHVIRNEDYATAELAQANLVIGMDDRLTFGRNEPALHHYQRVQQAALRELSV